MSCEYHILEKMATGSFGVVFKVRRVIDDQVFVMKRINISDMNLEERRTAAQEIRVMSRLSHPFIVAQRDAFLFNDDSLCIVMDYYDGGDLGTVITRQREKDEYLPMEQTMAWFAGMCLAMQYLHAQGIVHRDLKTHNVFLDFRRNEVAIGDFGVAEFFVKSAKKGDEKRAPATSTSPAWQHLLAKRHETELPRECAAGGGNEDGVGGHLGAAVRGTPLYMAPEVLESGACSPSSDVWSLGCILYELLSLRHPFETRGFAALMMRVMSGLREPLPPHYPPEIAQLVDCMLCLDPAQRPSCEKILRSPVMSAHVQRLVATRVPCNTPDVGVERTWTAQLQQLGVNTKPLHLRLPVVRDSRPAPPPSQELSLAEKREIASPSSPDMSTYGDDSLHFQTPQRPLSSQSNSDSLLTESHSAARIVEDMRHKSLAHIEEEVVRYRRLVQSEMRAQKQQRDAAMHRKLCSDDDAKMERYYNTLPRVGPAPTTTASAACQTFGNSIPPLSLLSSSSHSLLLHEKEHASKCSVALPKWPPGSLEASLVVRRQNRMDTAMHVLGCTVFFLVYNYYKKVEMAGRDVATVMQMVPDRSQWHVLPLVEEIVLIERLLERAVASELS